MSTACPSQARKGLEPDDPASGVAPRRSKSGKRRAWVLLAVHAAIALHIAHWWTTGSTLTPLEPSESMEFSKRGLINAGAIFFALTILSTAVFGRFFCGWACHLVALQDGCRWLLVKLGIKPRPVQLGILGSVPWIVFVYMFLAPLVFRALNGLGLAPTSLHLSTNLFWATFPGWAMALATFAVCGGALVYFLGAKGFCTYGCPYGAIFGIADQLSPLRIRVTDACNGCGHCTAVCTSNVRVHQEVRDWKAVVDPGCMKCLDCVSVCPMDALYLGFGAPALATSRARAPKAAAPRRPLLARVLLPAAFMASCFSLLLFHGGTFELELALVLVPLSLAVGLLFAGKAERPGAPSLGEDLLLAAVFLLGLYGFRGYALIPGIEDGVPLLLAVGLAGLAAYFALVLLRLATRAGVAVQSRELLRGNRLTPAGWTFAAFVLPVAGLLANGTWTQSKHDRSRFAYDRGVARAIAQDLPSATREFEHAVRLDPAFLEARENLAGMYCAAGRFEQGISEYRAALAIRPGDAGTHYLLGVAELESGDPLAAEEQWNEAVRLLPSHVDAHLRLAELLEQRGDRAGAERHRRAAREADLQRDP